MDLDRYAWLTRTLATRRSRRAVVSALGIGILGHPTLADARNRKQKHKQRKRGNRIRRNAFGCVNVGGFCKNDGQCCSGICRGKKGKKRCQAHDVGSCTAQDDGCAGDEVTCTTSGGAGACFLTTGGAPFCGADGDCFACTRDADCVPFCGAGAACTVCATECGGIPGGAACLSAPGSTCTFV